MYGYMGKILHVNLNNQEIDEIPTKPYAEQFLGGRGIASKIYWDTVAPEVGVFEPENRLIFMAGPLVATGTQGATRLSVVSKSPMAFPEGYCYGNIGGSVGPELKRAGFDGVVVEGRASKPVCLWIHDNEAEIQDASNLWGQGAYRVSELIKQAYGERVRFITTGVAGENKVRTAVIVADQESSATGGFGAVMGSKNLKVLVIKGTGKPSVAEPERLNELNRYTVQISQRAKSSGPPMVRATGHAHLVERIKKGNCYQCGLECMRGIFRYGKRLDGLRKCQSQEYYLPWVYSKEDEAVDTFFDAPTLANDYSVCTFELRSMINWLYTCYKSGYLTEKGTGLPLAKIGTREFLEKLLHSIAHREGFGDVLAEGLVRADGRVPGEARAALSPTIAPVGEHDLAPPRAFVANSLLYSMEPRVHQPSIHWGFTPLAWILHRRQPDSSPVSTKIFHDIARIFWGSDEAGDVSSYEGKALAAKKIQDRTYIEDSLGLCSFAWPITYSLNTPDHLGDPDLEGKLFSAVTGISYDKFERYAETIFNLQRAILLREGREVPQSDFPPEFNFTEPIQLNPMGSPMLVPGPGEEVVDTTGRTLDRDKFKGMLREYYRLRGWDEETGLPRLDTLSALGLNDVMSQIRHS
jgi:aldehyde:ferredoxin oxidoreductase